MEKQAPVLIVGSGRSGTTWIQDVIAESACLKPVYEALQPFAVKGADQFANRVILENEEAPELREFMDQVFSGKLNSIWSKYRILPYRLVPWKTNDGPSVGVRVVYRTYRQLFRNISKYHESQKRTRPVIKLIRANLMLGWLLRNYQLRILYVLRHPCAVIASKLTAGGESWAIDQRYQQDLLRRYREDPVINTGVMYGNDDLLSSAVNPVVRHAVIWCIENASTLKEARRLGCCIAYYEQLTNDGIEEWRRIFHELNLDAEPKVSSIRMPSEQAGPERQGSYFDNDKYARWQSLLSKDELTEIQHVLDRFQVNCYHTDDPLPIYSANEPRISQALSGENVTRLEN